MKDIKKPRFSLKYYYNENTHTVYIFSTDFFHSRLGEKNIISEYDALSSGNPEIAGEVDIEFENGDFKIIDSRFSEILHAKKIIDNFVENGASFEYITKKQLK